MRTFSVILAAVSFATAAASAQQQEKNPNLIVTIYGGIGSGHDLWDIPRQTFVVGGSTSNPPDTARLTRQVTSAVAFGGVFQLFPRGALGFSVDIGYRSLGIDDTCTRIGVFTSARNVELCDNITAQGHPGGSVITLGASGIARLSPGKLISPYVRLGGNLAFTTVSTIEVAAPDTTVGVPRLVIGDDSPRRNSLGMLAAGGLMVRAGAAYQIRLEIRDDMSTFKRVTGPASPVAEAPTDVQLFHNLGFVLGFDVLLEQKRVRRY